MAWWPRVWHGGLPIRLLQQPYERLVWLERLERSAVAAPPGRAAEGCQHHREAQPGIDPRPLQSMHTLSSAASRRQLHQVQPDLRPLHPRLHRRPSLSGAGAWLRRASRLRRRPRMRADCSETTSAMSRRVQCEPTPCRRLPCPFGPPSLCFEGLGRAGPHVFLPMVLCSLCVCDTTLQTDRCPEKGQANGEQRQAPSNHNPPRASGGSRRRG